jgi:hypothetical protein
MTGKQKAMQFIARSFLDVAALAIPRKKRCKTSKKLSPFT